jgi:hypothetical protein
MSLSDVGVPDQHIDVLNGGDVDPSGRLLSVAEIQQAFRDLLRTRDATGASSTTDPATAPVDDPSAPHTSPSPLIVGPNAGSEPGPASLHTSREPAARTGEAALHTSLHTSVTPAETTHGGGRLGRDWIAVVAAHSGAGASCVALAISDALSNSTRPSRLIEVAHPHRSGLAAAAAAELGMDPTGAWRRGSRQLTTLFRRAAEMAPGDWPDRAGTEPTETVIDLGLPAPANLALLVADRPQVVVTCRVTVPGLRLAEHLIAELGDLPVLLAAVGAGRWPGEVSASLGPRLRELRGARRVVPVPDDRRLQVTGLTNSPLPKSVAAAGRALLGLIDATRSGGVTTSAPPAPRQRGTTR